METDEPAEMKDNGADDQASQPDAGEALDDPTLTIQLDQFLKLIGVAATGGQAKLMIQGGEVSVNGEIETRRRRKLKVGDLVQMDDESWEVSTG